MIQPKHPLAARVAQLEPSGIRKVFEIAHEHPEYINLSIGEPDFDMPMFLKEEGIKAILAGYNRYTPTRGIPQLRRIVADQLTAEGIRFGDLIITAGATGALLLSIQALVDQGDEVIVPDPYFVAYRNIVYMAGGKPVSADTYPDFQIRAAAIEPLITGRTRALILNSPNNPTGMIYAREELEKIVALADKHGFHIISDEVYTPFMYEGGFTSVGQLTGDAIVVNSFSKSAAMTGWRLGYVSGPTGIIDKMAMLQQYAYASTNSVAQYTALRAFEVDYGEQRSNYQRKRDICYEMLADKYAVLKPAGSFYIFPQAPEGDASAFFQRAREAGVLIIPGKDFSRRDTHFRISFAVADEVLIRGLEILITLA
ncbi:MAG TPA: aminotransferase class I/II-fold pyridoxal phosphate-dependent enzyme [bacterium]|nr:aminotransferase class I/II-fold pyridoxal phosphate-dependent enzyme [bacterium]HPR88824.1 aminotransferase class I/II-fold pyridoxal phosphate-dependent enzyme [bacterium]